MSGFTINTVTLSGTLTRDPELRSTAGGTDICKLRIAVDDRYKDKSTGEWESRSMYFDVTMFGGIGRWLSNNTRKGDSVVIGGRLHWHEWEARDGGKRQAVDVIADSVVPVPRDGASRSSGSSNGGQRQDAPVPAGSAPSFGGSGFDAPPPGADDDIPF
jgi:single-strand DNA-binding protein